MVKSGLAFAEFNSVLFGPDHWHKKQYDKNGADGEHHSAAGRPFLRSSVKGSSKEKTRGQAGDEPAEVSHIVNVALKRRRSRAWGPSSSSTGKLRFPLPGTALRERQSQLTFPLTVPATTGTTC